MWNEGGRVGALLDRCEIDVLEERCSLHLSGTCMAQPLHRGSIHQPQHKVSRLWGHRLWHVDVEVEDLPLDDLQKGELLLDLSGESKNKQSESRWIA